MNAVGAWYRDRSLAAKITLPTVAVLAAAAGLQLAYLTGATRENAIAQASARPGRRSSNTGPCGGTTPSMWPPGPRRRGWA